jgi:hypothetical protein
MKTKSNPVMSKLILFILMIVLMSNKLYSQIAPANDNPIKVNRGNTLILKTKLSSGKPEDYKYSWSGPNSFGSTSQEPNIKKFADSNAGTYTVKITSTADASVTFSTMITATALPHQVKIGFSKKPMPVSEGEEVGIDIQTLGIIETGKTVNVEYSILKSDAVEDIDYKKIGPTSFTFAASSSENDTINKQTVKIQLIKDDNQENEKITLKLKISNLDKDWMVEETIESTINIKDYSSPEEIRIQKINEAKTLFKDNLSSRINSDKDTSEVIGTISFKKKLIKLFEFDPTKVSKKKCYQSKIGYKLTFKEREIGYFLIDSVKAAFRNGVLDEIQTFGTKLLIKKDDTLKVKDRFENILYRRRIPINIRDNSYSSPQQSLRHYSLGDNTIERNLQYIYFKDYIDYLPHIEKNYSPGDGEITLSKAQNYKELKLSTSLNSYIDFNLYSDLLSVLDPNIGNGLLQTYVRAKILWNTKNIGLRNTFIFHFIDPYISYSRFDNDLSSVALKYNLVTVNTVKTQQIESTEVDRQLLNQRAYLDLGLRANLISIFYKNKSSLEVNIGAGFQFSKIRGDTAISKTLIGSAVNKNEPLEYIKDGINMLKYSIGLKYSLNLYRNFGIDMVAETWYQKIWNGKALKDRIKLSPENSDSQPFFVPKIEMFYYPIKKSDDRIFLRLIAVNGFEDTESNYYQLQVGYKSQLKFNNNK